MKRSAIVLGSNGPSWQELDHAIDDAGRMARTLRSKCDFQVELVESDCNAFEATARIANASATCDHGDSLLLYFSGHGEIVAGKLYLLLSNTSPRIFDSAINAHHVIEYIRLSHASHKLIVLDCCHAGAAAGFKGHEDFPEDLGGGSELILCASNRLERAREIKELGGGFLTHHMCAILDSEAIGSVALRSLVMELRRRATNHNLANPTKSVPLPYLFGEDHSSFLIKHPKGSAPILIYLDMVDTVDTETLFSTIRPYLKWNSAALDRAPFDIQVPAEFTGRAATLSQYLETDQWPCDVEQRTKDQARYIAETVLPELKEDLSRATRMVMRAAALPDRSGLAHPGRIVLESYIRAKVTATKRLLAAYWLYNETEPNWREHLRHLDTVWSNRLINGLTLTIQAYTQWAFWTDADWWLDHKQVRIFVPQLFGARTSEFESYDEETFWRTIVPQLVEAYAIYELEPTSLYVVMHQDYRRTLKEISVRGEQFIETESHNSPDGNTAAKERAARVAADLIIERFMSLPDDKRRAWAIDINYRSLLLKGVRERVLQAIPNLDDFC